MIETLTILAMLTTADPTIVEQDNSFFLVNYYYYMLHQHADAKKSHEKWLKIRWGNMCKVGGKYQARATFEAYETGRPNPCDGSKVWKK